MGEERIESGRREVGMAGESNGGEIGTTVIEQEQNFKKILKRARKNIYTLLVEKKY